MKSTRSLLALTLLGLFALAPSLSSAECKSGPDYDLARTKATKYVLDAFDSHGCSSAFSGETEKRLTKYDNNPFFSQNLKNCYRDTIRTKYKEIATQCKRSAVEDQDYVPQEARTVGS